MALGHHAFVQDAHDQDAFPFMAKEQDLLLVRELILATMTDARETMDYKLPTYVRHGEAIAALASQKQYMSLYICHHDLLKPFSDRLKDYNCGKSCIRFRKVDDQTLLLFSDILKYVYGNYTKSQYHGKMSVS